MIGFPFQIIQQHLNQIIDIQELKLGIPIIHCDRKVVCNIITECSDSTVVVRTTPFAKEIWKPVYKNLRSSLFLISEEQFLTGKLAFAVFRIGITSNQCRLYRAGKHDRTPIAMPLQCIK